MKLQPLLIALAFVTGASFAQSPSTNPDQPPAKVHKKKAAHKKHATHHASAERHGTHAMGAGPATPTTDLNASARERRMDQAYNDWMARRR